MSEEFWETIYLGFGAWIILCVIGSLLRAGINCHAPKLSIESFISTELFCPEVRRD